MLKCVGCIRKVAKMRKRGSKSALVYRDTNLNVLKGCSNYKGIGEAILSGINKRVSKVPVVG
jgi:hypothetical protein